MKNKTLSFFNWLFLGVTILGLTLVPLVYIRKFNNFSDTPVWLTSIQFLLYAAFVVYTLWFIYNRIVKKNKTVID